MTSSTKHKQMLLEIVSADRKTLTVLPLLSKSHMTAGEWWWPCRQWSCCWGIHTTDRPGSHLHGRKGGRKWPKDAWEQKTKSLIRPEKKKRKKLIINFKQPKQWNRIWGKQNSQGKGEKLRSEKIRGYIQTRLWEVDYSSEVKTKQNLIVQWLTGFLTFSWCLHSHPRQKVEHHPVNPVDTRFVS